MKNGTLYVCNAFSLNMIPLKMLGEGSVCYKELSEHEVRFVMEEACEYDLNVVSAVGHEPTAAVFTDCLGTPVEFNRCNVQLGLDDCLVVGQYSGPRLQEGATELPPGADIRWLFVSHFGFDLFWLRAKRG